MVKKQLSAQILALLKLAFLSFNKVLINKFGIF